MRRIYDFCGGRKVFTGYLATVLLVVLALMLDASFLEVAGAILVALGITSGAVAWEDRERLRIERGEEP